LGNNQEKEADAGIKKSTLPTVERIKQLDLESIR
jgi:hypothetical protein